MLKVNRELFEKAVLQILASQEIEQLVTEFSLNRVFFYSLLNDVSMGKDSSNYQVLNEIALDRSIDEQLIVERANSIISYLTQDDPEEEYVKRFPALPIVVSGRFMEVVSGNFVYLSLFIIVILVLTFYILQSGMLFGGVGKGEFSQETEETKLPPDSLTVLEGEQRQNLTIGKTFFSENETDKNQGILSKEEAKNNEAVGSQNKKTILSEEIAKLTKEKITMQSSAKEGANVTTVNKEKDRISSTKKTSIEAPRGIRYLVKEGDTLWGIATRYKTSLDDIKTMNNLTSNSLKTGKVLIVPRSQSSGSQGTGRTKPEKDEIRKKNVNTLQTPNEQEKALSRQEITPEDMKRAEILRALKENESLSGNKEALTREGIETKNREAVSTDSAEKTRETKPQENGQEEKDFVQKQEDTQKEANIPRTTTSFESDTIKDIRSRLWNSDRNILGPE